MQRTRSVLPALNDETGGERGEDDQREEPVGDERALGGWVRGRRGIAGRGPGGPSQSDDAFGFVVAHRAALAEADGVELIHVAGLLDADGAQGGVDGADAAGL